MALLSTNNSQNPIETSLELHETEKKMKWQSFLESMTRKAKARFNNEVKAMVEDSELMSVLLSHQETIKYMCLWLAVPYRKVEVKSLDCARLFKATGNKEFQVKDYAASIKSYTKSAIYAPSLSNDLPIAIANRSASLFYSGKYTECLKDIELALALLYPEKLQYKLYLRAAECYLQLGKQKLAKEAISRVRELINNCDDIPNEKKEDIKKQTAKLGFLIFRKDGDAVSDGEDDVENDANNVKTCLRPELAFGENPEFSSASAAIEKRFDAEKGRYVVANRDIKKGEILFVEKPFSFVLLDHQKTNDLCEHCCHPYGDIPVPCASCVDTLYCDMKCCNEAWYSYHRWECRGSRMGLWKEIGIAHLALKVLLMCTTTTDRTKFNEVQKLVTNFDKVTRGDLIAYGITATMLTVYLANYTDYFSAKDLQECLVSKFSDETYNIDCDISTQKGKYVYQDRVATAIYPSASMMNHSCDPNIINSFMDQYLIIKATRDIAEGEEIFNCYGPHFRRMPREHRQEVLKSQYFFTCKCEPCTIPELQYFLERFSAIKCPECKGALYNIHNYSLQCLDCGAMPIINCQIQIKLAHDFFDEAKDYIEMEKEEVALDKLKQCLSIRRNILYKYHEDITTTLDLIGKVYAIMGRWLDSIYYLEHSIAAVSERFGSSSIELANELNKLTDICIRYLQEELNTSTKWYKNILKKTRRYLDKAEEIINLNYGPWNNACGEIKRWICEKIKNFTKYRSTIRHVFAKMCGRKRI
ncbi:hypothetical protein KM043_005500 [Ampulex compressa]|nr:hypothetical protein KM043_005500 [Ampulex compressa]